MNQSSEGFDRITLTGVEAFQGIGCAAEERAKGQPFIVDVVLYPKSVKQVEPMTCQNDRLLSGCRRDCRRHRR